MTPAPMHPPVRPSAARWFSFFHPAAPAAVRVTEPAEIARQFSSWRNRILVSSIIGYATFYLVRKNLPIAMPVMEE